MKKKVLLLIATLFTCSAFTLGAAACDLTLLENSSSDSSSEEKISEGLSYELLENDTYKVTGIGDCEDTDIVIPSKYNGKEVTVIGESAFEFYTGLTSITIGKNVTSIENSAFANCSGVTSVTMGENVVSIGESAFLGCSSLTEIVIPESVTAIKEETFKDCTDLECVTINGSITSIGDSAFLDCENLKKISIPESVTSVGESAFNGCDGLTGVYISSVEAWCKISFDNSEANPLVYAGDLYLNDALITELEIPESITSIGNYAFEDCKSLTSITLPDSITSIGESAFAGLRSLTSIIISSEVTSIGDRAFFGSGSLTIYCETGNRPSDWHADWGYGCTIVWDCNNNDVATDGYIYVMSGGLRYGLKDGEATVVEQPENITTAQILENVTYKDKEYPVTSIEEYAFLDCDNFEFNEYESVKYLGSKTNDYFALVQASDYAYTIHGDTKIIGGRAFQYNKRLTNLTIPDGVISIGAAAFVECLSLRNVVVPDSVTSIGHHAFFNCGNLRSVAIGNGVKSIGESAFTACGILTGVYIKDVASWCNIAFKDADANPLYRHCKLYVNDELLTELEIPQGVTSIGDYAFEYCQNLTSVTIPESVTSIGDCAFFYCESLTSIKIPESVTSMGKQVFFVCPILIYCETESARSDWDSEWDYGSGLIVWDCKNNDVATDGYIYLKENGICYTLKDGAVTVVKNSDSSAAISIPESITYKGMEYSVTSIAEKAFYNYDVLTSVVIPDSVTSIGKMAFYSCENLTSVVLGKGVTFIGNSAFEYCNALTSVYYLGTAEAWSNIEMGSRNSKFASATVYYYIEKEEDVPEDDGNYWHYGDNDNPVAW